MSDKFNHSNYKPDWRKYPYFILIIPFILFTSACSEDEEGTPALLTKANVGTSDVTLFEQLKKSMDNFDKNQIWDGYDFSKRPMYFIHRDASGKVTKGFLINPHKQIKGAVKIADDKAKGLNIYQYDAQIETANQNLKSGNDAFEFYFEIEGAKYYLQAYKDTDVSDVANGSILLATHEVFHIFQGDKWQHFGVQDEANYPINKDLLALQILTTHIASKLPKENSKEQIKKYLEMYIAIRSKEIDLDPSPGKLVKNMANAQETFEGGARFVEFSSASSVLTGFNSQFASPDFSTITAASEVRSEFAFGIWYGSGAAVAYMLNELTDDTETKTAAGKSFYDQAKAFLNMSEVEKQDALKAAQDAFDWPAIQTESDRLSKLK